MRLPHIEAFEVEARDGCQECVLGEDDTTFAELSEIAQAPVQIRGRSSVLLVTPFPGLTDKPVLSHGDS